MIKNVFKIIHYGKLGAVHLSTSQWEFTRSSSIYFSLSIVRTLFYLPFNSSLISGWQFCSERHCISWWKCKEKNLWKLLVWYMACVSKGNGSSRILLLWWVNVHLSALYGITIGSVNFLSTSFSNFWSAQGTN